MNSIECLLTVSYEFREQMKALLRPYDFANLLRACNLKPREYEKSSYLTPMNELFRVKDLYRVIDEYDIRIVVVGKDLRYMEIQLGVSNKNWSNAIRELPISIMVLIMYQAPFRDRSMHEVAACVRCDSGIKMQFLVIMCYERTMYSNYLCITDTDIVACVRFSYNGYGAVELCAYEPPAPEHDVFSSSSLLEGCLKCYMDKYCNTYSDILETCYVTSSCMEPSVGSVHSKSISIPTDKSTLTRWNTIVLVMDYMDLSDPCNEMLSTGIAIPFTFNSF